MAVRSTGNRSKLTAAQVLMTVARHWLPEYIRIRLLLDAWFMKKPFGVPYDPTKDYRHWAGSPRQRALSFAHPALLTTTGSPSQVWGKIDLRQGQNLTALTTSFYQGLWQNPMLRTRCRPGQSPVLKRTYLPSSLVPLSKRFRQMDQVGAVAGHKSHLDGSTRYQIVQPPLVG